MGNQESLSFGKQEKGLLIVGKCTEVKWTFLDLLTVYIVKAS